MTPQVKIMNALKAIVEGQGYEFVAKYDYSNTGKVYIQKPGNFASVLSFAFSCQPDRGKLQFYPVGVEPVLTTGFTDRRCCLDAYFGYVEATKIEDTLDFVRKALPKFRKPLPKKLPDVTKQKLAGKDDLKKPINDLLTWYTQSAGTDFSGAVRDVMTELVRACGDEQIDASERFAAAMEVFDEEAALA